MGGERPLDRGKAAFEFLVGLPQQRFRIGVKVAGKIDGSEKKVADLSRGVPAQESVTWNRSMTLPGCVTLASAAPSGIYQVQARTAAVDSPVRTFKLEHLPLAYV